MIKKLSICIHKIFTIKKRYYETIKIIRILRIIMEDLSKKLNPKQVISYFKQQKQENPWYYNLYNNDLIFHAVFSLIVGVLITIIYEISQSDFAKSIAPKTTFLIVAYVFLIVIILFFLFLRLKKTQKKNEEFKNINEITNSSYHTIFDFFIRNMKSIKEAENLAKIKEFLKEYEEEKLFKILAKALSNFLKKLFPDEFETKIDIFKFNNNDNKLSPIIDTLINGAFRSGQKSTEFTIPDKDTDCESLAAFSFLNNKIKYIKNIEKKLNILESLPDDKFKIKLKDEENLYFKKDETVRGFVLGSILCFPLSSNDHNFGVLSIGFKEQNIEKYLKSIGITIEDFKKCISIFIKKYTKFVIFTSKGINNFLQISNSTTSSKLQT